MFRIRKKLLIILSLLFSLSIVAWFVFFAYATQWLEDKVSVVLAGLKSKGYEISFSTLKFSGNPLSIQATITNPHFKDSRGLVECRAQEIKLSMYPWEFSTLRWTLPGDQNLAIPSCGFLSRGTLQLKDASGFVQLNSKAHPDMLSISVTHLSTVLAGKRQPITLKDLSLNVSNMADPLKLQLSLSTHVENVDKLLPRAPSKDPFRVHLVADFSGFKPELPFPKSLPAWRDGGGVLEVRLLTIDWSPILAELEGTITLDEEMYPIGSFTSKISGYAEVINNMFELGLIKQKKATVALFMMNLLASSDDRGEKQLKAPITLQNRALTVGPARLLKLKPLE